LQCAPPTPARARRDRQSSRSGRAARAGRILVHGAENEPSATVEPSVVEPRRRTVPFDRREQSARAAFEVEHFEPSGEAREDRGSAERRETAEAVGKRNGSGPAGRGLVRPEPAAKDVGPLNLAVRGRPDHAFAEFVGRVDDDFAVKPH